MVEAAVEAVTAAAVEIATAKLMMVAVNLNRFHILKDRKQSSQPYSSKFKPFQSQTRTIKTYENQIERPQTT